MITNLTSDFSSVFYNCLLIISTQHKSTMGPIQGSLNYDHFLFVRKQIKSTIKSIQIYLIQSFLCIRNQNKSIQASVNYNQQSFVTPFVLHRKNSHWRTKTNTITNGFIWRNREKCTKQKMEQYEPQVAHGARAYRTGKTRSVFTTVFCLVSSVSSTC